MKYQSNEMACVKEADNIESVWFEIIYKNDKKNIIKKLKDQQEWKLNMG